MAHRLSVTKRFTFEAAHFLEDYKGACSRMHGHSYKLEVTVGKAFDEAQGIGDIVNSQGMVLDFDIIKDVVQPRIRKLDHTILNETCPVQWSTAEGLIWWLGERLRRDFYIVNAKLMRLRLWETESNYAELEYS